MVGNNIMWNAEERKAAAAAAALLESSLLEQPARADVLVRFQWRMRSNFDSSVNEFHS